MTLLLIKLDGLAKDAELEDELRVHLDEASPPTDSDVLTVSAASIALQGEEDEGCFVRIGTASVRQGKKREATVTFAEQSRGVLPRCEILACTGLGEERERCVAAWLERRGQQRATAFVVEGDAAAGRLLALLAQTERVTERESDQTINNSNNGDSNKDNGNNKDGMDIADAVDAADATGRDDAHEDNTQEDVQEDVHASSGSSSEKVEQSELPPVDPALSNNNDKAHAAHEANISVPGNYKRRVFFDVTDMNYEEYCAKHYCVAMENYRKNKKPHYGHAGGNKNMNMMASYPPHAHSAPSGYAPHLQAMAYPPAPPGYTPYPSPSMYPPSNYPVAPSYPAPRPHLPPARPL